MQPCHGSAPLPWPLLLKEKHHLCSPLPCCIFLHGIPQHLSTFFRTCPHSTSMRTRTLLLLYPQCVHDRFLRVDYYCCCFVLFLSTSLSWFLSSLVPWLKWFFLRRLKIYHIPWSPHTFKIHTCCLDFETASELYIDWTSLIQKHRMLQNLKLFEYQHNTPSRKFHT